MPKVARSGGGSAARRDPLDAQLRDDATGGPVRRKVTKAAPAADRPADWEGDGDAFLSRKLSRKVLDEARAQQEDDDDDDEFARAADGQKKRVKFRQQQLQERGGRARGTGSAPGAVRLRADEDDDEDDEDDEVVDFGADDGEHAVAHAA